MYSVDYKKGTGFLSPGQERVRGGCVAGGRGLGWRGGGVLLPFVKAQTLTHGGHWPLLSFVFKFCVMSSKETVLHITRSV